jgi:hypothetical protein
MRWLAASMAGLAMLLGGAARASDDVPGAGVATSPDRVFGGKATMGVGAGAGIVYSAGNVDYTGTQRPELAAGATNAAAGEPA